MSRRFAALCLLFALAAPTAFAQERERVVLVPRESVGWGIRNIGAGLSSFVGMYGYWYDDRGVKIDTVPAKARLDLYYIRANFQKLFIRTEAPVDVELPPRIQTTPKDAMIVRVAANGYKTTEHSYKVTDVPDTLLLMLDPLPNSLTFLGHTHFADRSAVTMRTTKEADFRLVKASGGAGFTVALAETADAREKPSSFSGGLLESVAVQQVGEDLLVTFSTAERDLETRSRHTYDAVRREHVYAFTVTKEGTRPPSQQAIEREMDQLSFSPTAGCNARVAEILQERLDADLIARAFRPSGDLGDLYRREAMKRLGRFDRGRVRNAAGEEFRTGSPIELELALQSASTIDGYFGLLAAYARTQPEPDVTLRSLVAPDLSADAFAPIWADVARACS